MNILVAKEKASSPNYIKDTELLKNTASKSYIKELEAKLEKLEDRVKSIPVYTLQNMKDMFLKNFSFDIQNPVNVSCLPDVEGRIKQSGVIYYDFKNDRFRVRSKDSWNTLNLT